jgi:hypothetical protein
VLLAFFPVQFSNWQGAGQSVARDIAKGQAGVFDAHKLVGHWFNQILFFDPVAVNSFGSDITSRKRTKSLPFHVYLNGLLEYPTEQLSALCI